MSSYAKYLQIGIALDPIHVGTGGARIGRVDLTIVRDPVTRIPKLPGSSLAGVYRTYVAMYCQEFAPNRLINGSQKPYYPDCAGLGQPRSDGTGGHCAQPDCPVCTVFGFARGKDMAGGFAGLAAFSDSQILLFPVPSRCGAVWISCPSALRSIGYEAASVQENVLYMCDGTQNGQLNLGWLYLPIKPLSENPDSLRTCLQQLKIPDWITTKVGVVPDTLFTHVVNSNLEVRTSVAIDPKTGTAEESALFSYEAIPRGTVLFWEIVVRNPAHFRIGDKTPAPSLPNTQGASNPSHPNGLQNIYEVLKKAHLYLEFLGVGGMGTRGMGRLQVLFPGKPLCGEPAVNNPISSAGGEG